MRILIAEDDVALAKFVCQGLEGEYHTVDVSPDGEQARTAISENDYDIVILDLNLPKLDGVTVLRQLAEKTQPSGARSHPANAGGRQGAMSGHRRR
jgi:DNA-binding response OmpR family regulator